MATTANDNTKCPPGQHEHEASLVEAGVEVCRWCGDKRPASVAPVVGVDLPGSAVADVVFSRAA